MQGKINNWKSECLLALLLRESGHGLHPSWKTGSNCEFSWGKQAEHILHMQQWGQPDPSRHWGHPKDLVIWPIFQPQLIPCSLLLLTGLQPYTRYFFPQIPILLQFLSFTLESSEFIAYSGHLSNVTSSKKLFQDSSLRHQVPPTKILSISSLCFIFLPHWKKN